MNLTYLISLIHNLELHNACEALLSYPEFPEAPAALHFHHAYQGGLLAHTLEVTELALRMTPAHPQVNTDVLIAAALWHDLAKIYEYKLSRFYEGQDRPKRTLLQDKGDGWEDLWFITDYGNKIHHINGSNAEFAVAAANHGVSREIRDAVSHCILSHHGPVKEWGSPVAPHTLEATLLHQADMQSAQFGATKVKPCA